MKGSPFDLCSSRYSSCSRLSVTPTRASSRCTRSQSGSGVDVPVADLLGEERGVDLRIRHPLGLRPADPRRLGGLGHRLDAVLRHSLRPRDRVSRHARLEQSQDLPGPDLPRHVLPPSLSVAWRAGRRRRRCRTGIRLVPNGNIGRWMERCRIAVPRVLTGAITQGEGLGGRGLRGVRRGARRVYRVVPRRQAQEVAWMEDDTAAPRGARVRGVAGGKSGKTSGVPFCSNPIGKTQRSDEAVLGRI